MRSAFGGYIAGLATTIVVMNVFEAAQPALLYIVPAVLGAVSLHAALRKETSKVNIWCSSFMGVEVLPPALLCS